MKHRILKPTLANDDLDCITYWKYFGTPTVMQLCAAADMSFDHWKHIANKRKRASTDLARRLVAASQAVTPGYCLSFDRILFPKEEKRVRIKANAIPRLEPKLKSAA